MLASAIVAAAFGVGNASGWIKDLTGYEPKQGWIYVAVFLVFAIIVVRRLIKLQAKIDDMRGGVMITALPTQVDINSPMVDEPPLKEDEYCIRATIKFEIWTDIDINTRSLALAIVGSRNLSSPWWEFWQLREKKRLLGIGPEGQNSANYRRQIKSSDSQPFKDQVTFRWRGKKRFVTWGDSFLLELVLWGGIPKNTWRVEIDPNVYPKN